MSFHKFRKQILSASNLDSPTALLKVINTLQNAIADSINTILAKVSNDRTVLNGIKLIPGQNNVVNTTLNRTLTGYRIIGQTNQADVWDNQANNPSPNLTLWLECSVHVTVNLEVF